MNAKSAILAVVVLAASAPLATAQPFGTADLGTGPTTGVGSITAQGGYTVQANWAPSSAQLLVLPMSGGVASSANQAAPANNKWGPLTVPNLAAGKYAVLVVIGLSGTGGNVGQTDTIYSAVSVNVNVANAAPNPVAPLGKVLFAANDPTNVKSTISVTQKGTYTTINNTIMTPAQALIARPVTGGEYYNLAGTQGVAGPPKNGTWGGLAVTNLPAGGTLVYGSIMMTDGVTTQTVITSVSVLPVVP